MQGLARFSLFCALVGSLTAFTTAVAGTLFAEAFDDSNANVHINQQPDTIVSFVDYSSMTVGSTSFNIPEAPRPIAGGLATRGVLMQANLSSAAAAGINMLAGSTPINFNGNYTMSFDAYMNLDPASSATTEQLLWGVGGDNLDPIEARNNRGNGAAGTWGWLANENGYGTEDAAINVGDVESADLGDTQPGESGPFNAAFQNLFGGVNAAPAFQWVRVDIVVAGDNVQVLFNDVEFFNITGGATDGFAMLGYEDPFSSVSDRPDPHWGLFDNFTVVPEPASLALLMLGLPLLRRRG